MDRHDRRGEQNDESSGTSWRVFGVLDVPAGPDTGHTITAWLEKNLGHLQLHKAFLNKICQSAGGAVARVLLAPQPGRFDRVCLNVFIPEQCQVAGQPLVGKLPAAQTWGFFQTEKIESRLDGGAIQPAFDLMIAIYLYPEG